VYTGVELDLVSQTALTFYCDVGIVHGIYGSLTTGHAFQEVWGPVKGVSVSVHLLADIGVCDGRFRRYYLASESDDWALVAAQFSAGFPVGLGDHVEITPSASCPVLLDTEIRRVAETNGDFWVGVELVVSR
jgi:hypothetical protein